MKIYSPSQLSSFQFCGTARQLSKQGWVSRYISPLNIAQWVGSAVAKGLEIHYRGHSTPVVVWNAALDEFEACYEHALTGRRLLGQLAENSMLTYKDRIRQFLLLGIESDPLKGWEILECEPVFVSNNSRPDIIGRDPDGCLSILDWKCMTEWPKRKQYTKYFESHFIGNQAMTYKYCYEIERRSEVERFYIALLTLDPKEVQVQGTAYSSARFDLWLQSAEVSWRRMEIEDETQTSSTENATHTNEYGQCEYYNACIYMNRDIDLMNTEYVQIERRKP